MLLTAAVALPGVVWANPDRPAANVRDLRDHFASFFQPPSVAKNTRVTFYFSMNAAGGLIGRPRTTWLGWDGPATDKARDIAAFETAFSGCLPVALDRRMAAVLPGEVYFLQYVVGPDGHDRQLLFRPFGSHCGIAPGVIMPRAPVRPGAPEPPPLARPAPAFSPRPMHGPVFDPPIVLPFPRR